MYLARSVNVLFLNERLANAIYFSLCFSISFVMTALFYSYRGISVTAHLFRLHPATQRAALHRPRTF